MFRSLDPRTRWTTVFLALFLIAPVACQDPLDTTSVLEDVVTDALSSTDEAEAFRGGAGAARNGRSLTVMTRNLYLGGDVGPVFAADFSNPIEVVQASATVWGQVVNSEIPDRMAAIADEVHRERPDLISIQEAFQFVELDLSSGTPTPVQFIDLLATLQAELAALGLDYDLVRIRANTNATLPIDVDLGTGQITRAVQFTDRIAMLAAAHVDIEDVTDDNYQATLTLTPGLDLQRGWIRVTTEHRGVRYHVIGTHLEVQGIRPIHDAQALELRTSVSAGLDGVTVIAGDLNSDAAGSPGEPDWTPTYGELIADGFADSWLAHRGRGRAPGFTCCQAPDLRNPQSLNDRRIDFILVRGDGFPPREESWTGWISAHLVGHRSSSLTPSGVWPSDHAGIVAELSAPRGLANRPHR